MLTSHNYALLLFRPAGVGERVTRKDSESRGETRDDRLRANSRDSLHFSSNDKSNEKMQRKILAPQID
jgi:hypothetical protein